MAEAGYKNLLSYKLANIAFQIGWEFVPTYYSKYEDSRQRDQIKQALRSYKQNIVEGSSERSLSSKLKLYDVAKASSMEALEDFEDILKFEKLIRWDKADARLKKLRYFIEGYPSSPPIPSPPSISSISEALGGKEGLEGKEKTEAIANYLIDVITRGGYMLDKQINAVEQKHTQEGGYNTVGVASFAYNENLLKKRLAYRSQ